MDKYRDSAMWTSTVPSRSPSWRGLTGIDGRSEAHCDPLGSEVEGTPDPAGVTRMGLTWPWEPRMCAI